MLGGGFQQVSSKNSRRKDAKFHRPFELWNEGSIAAVSAVPRCVRVGSDPFLKRYFKIQTGFTNLLALKKHKQRSMRHYHGPVSTGQGLQSATYKKPLKWSKCCPADGAKQKGTGRRRRRKMATTRRPHLNLKFSSGTIDKMSAHKHCK